MPDEAVTFVPPEVKPGDIVYWYRDPLNLRDPNVGIVVGPPGAMTITILLLGSQSGFVEKQSVRHKDDPGLRDNADWRLWGCWEYSSLTETIKRLDKELSRIVPLSERVAALTKKVESAAKNG